MTAPELHGSIMREQMVSFRADALLLARIRRIARAAGLSLSDWVRDALGREIERELNPQPGMAMCPHMSFSGVTAAGCGICGPLRVYRAA